MISFLKKTDESQFQLNEIPLFCQKFFYGNERTINWW